MLNICYKAINCEYLQNNCIYDIIFKLAFRVSLIPTALDVSFIFAGIIKAMASCNFEEYFGSNPINLKWHIVRGDTAKLRIQFLENDESTVFDTSGWEYASSAYDSRGDVLDELEVVVGSGYIDIIAASDITENWGTGSGSVVAELAFDLEVIIDDEVWTPIIGTVNVLGDVTGSL